MCEKVEIFVATHKPIEAKLPEGYLRAQVNCANSGEHWEGYIHDDSGENISVKNPNYSELSVMYWAWKNSNADIKGLVHYRRFFSKKDTCEYKQIDYGDITNLNSRALEKKEIIKYLDDADVLLAMPNGPYPIIAQEELEIYVYKNDIEAMTDVIRNDYPEYYEIYKNVMKSKHLSYFNMLIAKSEVFDGYCEWIFEVLGKVEQKCDLTGYDTQHKRIYGYFSEVLQNVYIEKNHLKKKYFLLLYPYQMKDMTIEEFNKVKKRERRFEVLKKTGLGVVEKLYYKKMHPALYKQKQACQEYVEGL